MVPCVVLYGDRLILIARAQRNSVVTPTSLTSAFLLMLLPPCCKRPSQFLMDPSTGSLSIYTIDRCRECRRESTYRRTANRFILFSQGGQSRPTSTTTSVASLTQVQHSCFVVAYFRRRVRCAQRGNTIVNSFALL